MQECIDKPQQNYENQPLNERPALFFVPIRRHVGCAWHWLDRNNGTVIALFTIVIGVFTLALFIDGRDKARKELRAYIALDDIYFRWKANATDPADRRQIQDDHPHRPRIRVKNFGHTPATNMTVRINGMMTTMGADFDRVYEGREYPAPRQMLAPTQKYGVWVHLHGDMKFDPHAPYDPDKELLVVHGAISYEDIYHRWWITRFCYCYDGANRFLPYTHYNHEEEYKNEEEALDSLSYVEKPSLSFA